MPLDDSNKSAVKRFASRALQSVVEKGVDLSVKFREEETLHLEGGVLKAVISFEPVPDEWVEQRKAAENARKIVEGPEPEAEAESKSKKKDKDDDGDDKDDEQGKIKAAGTGASKAKADATPNAPVPKPTGDLGANSIEDMRAQAKKEGVERVEVQTRTQRSHPENKQASTSTNTDS